MAFDQSVRKLYETPVLTKLKSDNGASKFSEILQSEVKPQELNGYSKLIKQMA